MVGKGKPLSSKQEGFALRIRGFLEQSPSNLALVADDLEDRMPIHHAVFTTYREPLDKILSPRGLQNRASVHFLVPMIEAYFLADEAALNEALGLVIEKHDGDPEEIRGAKGKLKGYCDRAGISYNERTTGEAIARRIDLERILSDPVHCASLRCLVKWCSRRIQETDSDRFQLIAGRVSEVTAGQVGDSD